jgi:hypothetical protein
VVQHHALAAPGRAPGMAGDERGGVVDLDVHRAEHCSDLHADEPGRHAVTHLAHRDHRVAVHGRGQQQPGVEPVFRQRAEFLAFQREPGPDRLRVGAHVPGQILLLEGADTLVELGQARHVGHGAEMVAPEEPDLAFDPALLVGALHPGQAVPGSEPVVLVKGRPAFGLLALPAAEDDLLDRDLQVVVAHHAGRYPAEHPQRVGVPVEEGFQAHRGIRLVDRTTGVAQAQREQEALGHLPVEQHPQLTEVDLRIRARGVGALDEPRQDAGSGPELDQDLRAAPGDIVGDVRVRHRRPVLPRQPIGDARGGVPLLGRGRDVLAQPLIDHCVVRAEDRGTAHRGLAWRRLRIGERLAYQVTADPELQCQCPDRQALLFAILAYTEKELFFP